MYNSCRPERNFQNTCLTHSLNYTFKSVNAISSRCFDDMSTNVPTLYVT